MKREMHPMQAKKDLARRIVADFHSAEAAEKVAEDWAKQFQKDEVPGNVEEVQVRLASVLSEHDPGGVSLPATISLPRLLVECGLAESSADATRKIKQESVWKDNKRHHRGYRLPVPTLPAKILLRVGRRIKLAVISE